MKLADLNTCTGCGACLNACSKGAIKFKKDKEGFPTPYILPEKCVECGLCGAVCPAMNMPETYDIKDAYAAQLVDKESLQRSTSGGVFSAFSNEIFRRDGIVYGCVWDKNYNAVITKAENEDELEPMHGSKYVWSWAGDTFPEIKRYLENGRTVLFSGLPCQAAGLRNYLGRDYDRLYILTFFCGGVPSPLALHSYLKTIRGNLPLSRLDLKFRDKSKDGAGIRVAYNKKNNKRVYESYVGNSYYYSFSKKICLRLSCYHCQYRYKDRVEDITMGDYWGIEKYHSEFDIRAGVSAVLINTDKGRELFDAVSKDLKVSPTEVHNIAKGNNLTVDDRTVEFRIPGYRDDFFRTIKEKDWSEADKKYLMDKERIRLLMKERMIRCLSPVIPGPLKRALKKII